MKTQTHPHTHNKKHVWNKKKPRKFELVKISMFTVLKQEQPNKLFLTMLNQKSWILIN